MIGIEVDIWDRFLDEHKDEYDRFDYDVHVGKPPKGIEKYPPEIRLAVLATHLFRIDVVGWQGEVPTIFEVKEYASCTAIGQVLTYAYLFVRDKKPKAIPKLAIVTDYCEEDIKEVAKHYGIKVYEVGRI